jgi:hypothetical protein
MMLCACQQRIRASFTPLSPSPPQVLRFYGSLEAAALHTAIAAHRTGAHPDPRQGGCAGQLLSPETVLRGAVKKPAAGRGRCHLVAVAPDACAEPPPRPAAAPPPPATAAPALAAARRVVAPQFLSVTTAATPEVAAWAHRFGATKGGRAVAHLAATPGSLPEACELLAAFTLMLGDGFGGTSTVGLGMMAQEAPELRRIFLLLARHGLAAAADAEVALSTCPGSSSADRLTVCAQAVAWTSGETAQELLATLCALIGVEDVGEKGGSLLLPPPSFLAELLRSHGGAAWADGQALQLAVDLLFNAAFTGFSVAEGCGSVTFREGGYTVTRITITTASGAGAMSCALAAARFMGTVAGSVYCVFSPANSDGEGGAEEAGDDGPPPPLESIAGRPPAKRPPPPDVAELRAALQDALNAKVSSCI